MVKKTFHIVAESNAFAKTLLMPGDPKRSEYIAKKFLKHAKLVNDVRGMKAYTGLYKGVKVSVMASGMGMASMGIFCHELYSEWGVENIIRVGTCGAINENLNLMDVFVSNNAITNSNILDIMGFKKACTPSKKLLDLSSKIAITNNLDIKYGTNLTSDIFYGQDKFLKKYSKTADICEMETAMLYATAISLKKNALSVFTVSDIPSNKQQITPDLRQKGLNTMITFALDIAKELN